MVFDVLVLLYEQVPVSRLQLEDELVVEDLFCCDFVRLTGMDSYNQVQEGLTQSLFFDRVYLLAEPILRKIRRVVVK